MIGAGAADVVARDREPVARLGGGEPRIESCGVKVVNDPATVVMVEKVGGPRARRIRKDR
jgi:16S rRNA (guanine527-N7)-methyltransferase